MIGHFKFVMLQNIKNKGQLEVYKEMVKNIEKDRQYLERERLAALQRMLRFSSDHVPFYRDFMAKEGIAPEDICDISDLDVFPIVTKTMIRDNYGAFLPDVDVDYVEGSTGGTTGTPLKYRMSKDDYFLGRALLWRGWGYAGYELGDRMVYLGGGSIVSSTSKPLRRKAEGFFLNIYGLSSYEMSESNMAQYVEQIRQLRPRFIRGYASSLFELARYMNNNRMSNVYKPKAVFSTADMLTPERREVIERAFGTEIYDQYGLNDGGVSAFECEMHQGFHIDMERSILQVVDEDGKGVEPGEMGRIIASTLHNSAMPLIRYETGDMGTLSREVCPCGNPYPLLSKLNGRIDDFIITPDNKRVHAGFVRVIIKNIDWVREFQTIQTKKDWLVINIVPEGNINFETDIRKIKAQLTEKLTNMQVEIRLCDQLEKSVSNKHQFFISEL